jgi:hypothetical protein
MDDLTKFQTELLQSADARKEFAANPAAYLNKLNIPVPAGTRLPKSIPLNDLEKTVGDINTKLKQMGVDVAKLRSSDAASVSKFVGEATYQPQTQQEHLDQIASVVAEYNSRIAGGDNPGDAQTALAIGAIVVAVVATPVKVYSIDVDTEEDS